MVTNLEDSEQEKLVTLYLSEAIKKFPYPRDNFFETNKAVLSAGGKPKSTQLNGLWQMALNAKDIDEMCDEIINKISRSTLPEWRIEVINTLEGPRSKEQVEIWKFLVQVLICIKEFDMTCRFLDDFRRDIINEINRVLVANDFDEIKDIPDFELSQRLDLARSFIHRFVSRTIVQRKIEEG